MSKLLALLAINLICVTASRAAQSLVPQAPRNDSFSMRKRLSGTHVGDRVNNGLATSEPGEPDHTGNFPERSVWWTWKATRDGMLFIRVVQGTDLPHMIAAYTGEALEELQQVAFDFGQLAINVTKGTTYQIVVDDSPFGNSTNLVRLRLSLRRPPRNDDIANARLLSGRHSHAIGSVIGATLEANEPWPYNDSSHSVWWKWTAPEDGRYTFSAVSTNMNPLLALYRNELGENVLMDLPITGDGFSQINIPLAANDALAISVDGKIQTTRDRFQLRVRKTSPPPNDNFENRISLVEGHGIGSNEAASYEPGEPNEDSDYRSLSVWWQFTPATSAWYTVQASITITSAVPAVTFPAWLELYTGETLATLERLEPEGIFEDSANYPSFYLFAGTNYAIQVNEAQGRFGEIRVRAQFRPPPVNDYFTNATDIPAVEDYTASGAIAWATAEPGEPFADFDGLSVWWRWTAPSTGTYALEANPENLGGAYDIFQGGTLATLTPVTKLTTSPNGVLFQAVQGALYYISARSDFLGSTIAAIRFRLVKRGRPVNDVFANRSDLFATPVTNSNRAASREVGEPNYASDPDGGSIWWRFTAQSNGWHWMYAIFHDENWPFQPRLIFPTIYEGDALTNLTRVPSVIAHFSPRYFLTAGVEYAIEFSHPDHRWGTVELTIRHQPSPPNDNFTNAFVLAGDSWIAEGSNHWATAEPNETIFWGESPNSIWWEWTAERDGPYELWAEAPYYGVIRAYTGNAVDQLTIVGAADYRHRSSIVEVRAGVTYHFSFTSPVENESRAAFFWRRADRPPNDDFVNRTLISGTNVSGVGSNYFATGELNDPIAFASGSVWWGWTATNAGTVTVTVASTEFLFGAVFRGDSLTNLVTVADLRPFPITFSAEAGVEYSIGIIGSQVYGLQFVVNIEQVVAFEAAPAKLSLRVLGDNAKVIETSTNLTEWHPFGTVNSQTNFTIQPRKDEPQRFFRVRQ